MRSAVVVAVEHLSVDIHAFSLYGGNVVPNHIRNYSS